MEKEIKHNKRQPQRSLSKWDKITDGGKRKAKWCTVDIHNKFEYLGMTHIIHDSVKQYEVKNKAWEVENWTNEAKMTEILVIDDGEVLDFYDETMKRVNPNKIELA